MQTEESVDQLECSKCGQYVEQVLALQCNHNLCLNCAAKSLSNDSKLSSSGQQLSSLKCEICGVLTLLDPNSAQVLSEIRQNENLQQEQEFVAQQEINQQISRQKNDQTNINIVQEQKNNQQQYMSNEKSSYRQSPINNQGSPQIQQNSQYQNQNQADQSQNYNNNNQQQYNQQEGDYQISNYCRDHPSEETILYCFTCDSPCICMECYLNGLHKNHEVQNIRNKYENLQNGVDDLKFKVKTRSDFLLNDESRLTQKKRELIELVSSAKSQIKQSFDEIFQVLEQKQAQLLQNTEDLMEEKFMEIDRTLAKVQGNNQFLQNFEAQLNRFYYESDRTTTSDIRAFNFYAENKQRILQNLADLDRNFFSQVRDKLNCDFLLDTNSVYQHLEAVQGVKIEIMSLKGVESQTPTLLEQQLFEQARQDKNNRRFNQFQGTNNGNPIRSPQQQQQQCSTDQSLLKIQQQRLRQQQQQVNISQQNLMQQQQEQEEECQNQSYARYQQQLRSQQQEQSPQQYLAETEKRVSFLDPGVAVSQNRSDFRQRQNNNSKIDSVAALYGQILEKKKLNTQSPSKINFPHQQQKQIEKQQNTAIETKNRQYIKIQEQGINNNNNQYEKKELHLSYIKKKQQEIFKDEEQYNNQKVQNVFQRQQPQRFQPRQFLHQQRELSQQNLKMIENQKAYNKQVKKIQQFIEKANKIQDQNRYSSQIPAQITTLTIKNISKDDLNVINKKPQKRPPKKID
ncbi:hypothetical protein PPERSA_03374 [Pseudocohnilembus persalinus]|uniref:B box-type domain-containing protein n=1 Tax=Pseudocohnilembus persalinus TaxID=266149 RepID=A0A0V0R1I4_PSEPJ|nr:hypothetical protein PPERSA_03374 [Pseudocohnilembus persalinus]|eukprot:KRX08380.1 hypothetical protein PPERSA_03374 [Pseudocohnilembus persalinus]